MNVNVNYLNNLGDLSYFLNASIAGNIADEKKEKPSDSTDATSKLDVILQLASRPAATYQSVSQQNSQENYVLPISTQKNTGSLNNFYHSSYSFKPQQLYSSNSFKDYIFRPLKISVTRVPQYGLGEGVLGRTWTNKGIVEILYGLYGNDFDEVLMHEILHNIYPDDPEWMIRQKTRDRMPFDTKWN